MRGISHGSLVLEILLCEYVGNAIQHNSMKYADRLDCLSLGGIEGVSGIGERSGRDRASGL